jgi:hypothetical protein
MTSNVEIANRALTRLGDRTIVSLTEDSNQARAINAIFESVRRTEIRKHPWNFAKARAQLAADADAPLFGYSYQYTLPADCLRVLPKSDPLLDWRIEGKKIVTNESGPLDIVYIADVTDPNQFDETFIEVLASKLAEEASVRLSNAESKKAQAREDYRAALLEARRTNAIERLSDERVEDLWELARV